MDTKVLIFSVFGERISVMNASLEYASHHVCFAFLDLINFDHFVSPTQDQMSTCSMDFWYQHVAMNAIWLHFNDILSKQT